MRQILAFLLRYTIAGLALAFLLSLAFPQLGGHWRGNTNTSSVSEPVSAQQPPADIHAGRVSYADAVTRASPAVVNIYANKVSTVRQYRYRVVPDPVTQRLLGAIALGPAYQRHDQNLGSGVIFSADGYVLTNNHVIAGADDIQVLLDDGRATEATVIGSDPWTDLAVLRIDLDALPTIALTGKKNVSVGDVVLAIGNPVGIGKTVTMGIVSATGRQLQLSAHEDFIQTDAAINAGNSGGALVDALGDLVGINTAIYPRTPSTDSASTYTPGTEGIGFAIPVATAKAVLEQIIEHGSVIRGWLGIDYVDAPLSSDVDAGVLVTDVHPGGPAALAGIEPGDLLLTVDGDPVSNHIVLRNIETAGTPGAHVTVTGQRAGRHVDFEVVLGQRPPPSSAST